MKLVLSIVCILSIGFSANAQFFKKDKEEDQKKVFKLNNDVDSLSYALGISVADEVKSQNVDSISVEAFLKAIKSSLKGDKQLMNTNDARLYYSNYIREKQEEKAELAKVAGVKFLEENKTKEGVTTLPSGLQYKILKKSNSGEKPVASDRVKVHYHGTLIDGTVFDSSVERGRPATFPVNAVIKGWVEALQLMEVGDKWMLYIPQDLAYGGRAAGQIPPYSTLIFEVELLEIVK
ncbi:FKBP-type peptidyl-prolyl cis-trans isomerase [Luteibaculum oceani]|uniref:Peptidyl-prolyl cis-trans isomerase n=1 Tax=Luteibaculum oceani TaxID=1294296 RepID=A0A5C6V995_9FLAO|nr:FKBP-type peptidyl-prolyl cis-trans isomerase [Luteibaculum oceani]TXC82022.1 FKBP-type peptidyl-prolyl cis-trans isomerase [Luteibaculum oceani]